MNKNKFVKIVSFFLSVPCLANSDTLAMKQSQLYKLSQTNSRLSQVENQLDQISGDMEKAGKGILDFLLKVKDGYIDRYLKNKTIEYFCKYGWLSGFKFTDPKEKFSRYIEFNSFLDEDNVMTLKINFYPKTGRVMVRKTVESLSRIQEKNKNFYSPRHVVYDSKYKILRKACFFNCYLGPKEKSDLTQLFKELRETIYNCDREVENVKKIRDLSNQFNADFGYLIKKFNMIRNLNFNFVYDQNICNNNILIDNNLNVKKLDTLSYNGYVTPLDENIKNTNVDINELTFGSDNSLNNNESLDYDTSSNIDSELRMLDDVINSIKNNSDFENTKNNYIDFRNLTFKVNDFKGNGDENDESHLSDCSDDNIRGLNDTPFINPNDNFIHEETNED